MTRRFLPMLAGILFILVLQQSGLINGLQSNIEDLLFELRGPRTPSHSIIVIGVDQKSQDMLGSWPFPRDLHAALLARVSQAAAIGFDFLFTAETHHDRPFSSAMKSDPPVILAIARTTGDTYQVPSLSLSGYSQIGHVETLRGRDGIVREVILEENSKTPSLALALYREAGLAEIQSAYSTPLRINYLGPQKTFLTISYADVIAGKYNSENGAFFTDSFILVGADDPALGDTHTTPYSIKSGSPGVEIQANILHNLLSHNFLQSLNWLNWLLLSIPIVLALGLWPNHSEQLNIAINSIAILLVFSLAILLFYHDAVIDIVTPLILLISSYMFHLLIHVILLTTQVFRQVDSLDRQLHNDLDRLYHTIPSHLDTQQANSCRRLAPDISTGFLEMESASHALGLQHDFIEKLLSLESPPLILWEKINGSPCLTNRLFDELWHETQEIHSGPPDITTFLNFINTNSSTSQIIDPAWIESEQFTEATSDTVVQCNARGKKYYRVVLRQLQLHNGQFTGILGGLTDVTEIKEMERIKDEIVSIVSHELKLPLTTIIGYGEMLVDMSEGKQKKYAKKICEQSQRLNTLIADFLDINKLESGKDGINRYPYDFKFVIEESINSVYLLATQKHINITTDLPSKVTPLVGDEHLLLQAVINVVENSVKYSPANTTVHIKLAETATSLRLTISDQGPGIPKHEQKHIFNKFTRGSNKHEQAGFGLGLNFVQQVVLMHDGTVQFIDTDQSGATLELTLPKQSH
ncbi:CHASE2 domain-containing protein [Desulfosediminicola flagellatus]|uniref:CHASE2 domain-containing protein n=1 Tax=Desulfosediminicola flagellatus TaxID=2569541 RepID=UPI0010AD52CC|nr:CHASE2 domain-containing protein [Desulfosediminicola flagellatus]